MANRSKFYQLPPVTPWPSLSTAIYKAAGDVDGDGRQEVVAMNASGGNVFFCTLSHINRGELTPFWESKNWGDLVVMDTQINALGQWTFSTDDYFVLADLDGDGADEIIAFHSDGRIAVFDWAVTGSGATAQLAITNVWFQQSSLSGPGGTWDFSGKEFFRPADLDGNGSQEVVIFDGSRLGVLKWNGSSLSLLSLSSQTLPAAPGITPWIISPLDTIYRVHLGQSDYIAAFDGMLSLGLFEWAGSALQVKWSTFAPIGQWQMKPGNALASADLDGDGDQELFVYDGSSTAAVMKWQGSQFNLITSPVQQLTGTFQWTFAPGQTFRTVKVQQTENIIGFDGRSLGWIGFANDALQAVDVATGFAAAGQWTFSPLDHLIPANIDGEGIAELFIADTSGNAAVLKYGVAAVYTARTNIGAWSIDYIMAAPSVPLAPFTGGQLPVYQYMSTYVNSDSLGDIRSEYLNTQVTGFDTYSTTIEGLANPPGKGFSDADWNAVQAVLVPELQSVCPTRGLFANLDTLALDVSTQQDSDLGHVVGLVNKEIPQDNSKVGYILGQIFDALIWGAAVGPEKKAGQFAMALLASLFGGALGLGGGTPPQTANYSDFKCDIDNQFLQATKQNDDNATTAMTDAGLLAVLGQLASQGWKWDPNQSVNIALLSQNANRIAFYQTIIPVRFEMIEFPENPTPYPYVDAEQQAPWSYWATALTKGLWNVYMLGYPDSFFHPYGFPSQDLMNDLFSNLGVSQEQFFIGMYGWSSINRVIDNNSVAA